MTMNDINNKKLNEYVELINKQLYKYIAQTEYENMPQKKIVEAMWYSLSAGGKRIRPVLVLEFNRMLGGCDDDALACACAIEMIHTYSLIHDDLPCMDNDDMRRGRPSCHKQYGEALALLAGDALQNYAFDIISNDGMLSDEKKVKVMSCLTSCTGVMGMIGGQVIDIDDSNKLDLSELVNLYLLKTSDLLTASCQLGCICAGAYDQLDNARIYAENLGVAFQLVDDILDIKGDEKELGKPVGSDKKQDKKTFAEIAGIEYTITEAKKYTDEALNIIKSYDNSEFLIDLTKEMLIRKK